MSKIPQAADTAKQTASTKPPAETIDDRILREFDRRYEHSEGWKSPFWLALAWLQECELPPGNVPAYEPALELCTRLIETHDHLCDHWDEEGLVDAFIAIAPTVAGPDPIKRAYRLAEASPATDIMNCSPRLRVLLATARHLAQWFPKGFTMPQFTLRELCGCTQPAISHAIRRLVREGWLVELEGGTWSYQRKRAKLYALPKQREEE